MRIGHRIILLGALGIALALASLSLLPAYAAVTLVSFEATSDGQRVLLTWETASEIDMIGFYILRADSEAGEYRRIPFGAPTLVFASGGVIGGSYELWDDAVTDGRTYYYKLEALETTGFAEFFGPIAVTVGTPASPTPSRTPSPTATSLAPTATSVPGTSSPTPRPVVPTSTPSPSPSRPPATGAPSGASGTAVLQPVSTATPTVTPSPLRTSVPLDETGETSAYTPPTSDEGGEGTPSGSPVLQADSASSSDGEAQPTAIVLSVPTAIPTITRQAQPSATPRPARTVSHRGVQARDTRAGFAGIGLPPWTLLPAGLAGVIALAACAFAIRRLWRAH